MQDTAPNLLAATLDRSVEGRHLGGPTFRDQLDPDRPTLVVFLRHFG